MLTLTWIKGEPLPENLVNDVLKSIGLARETDEQRKLRRAVKHVMISPEQESTFRKSVGKKEPWGLDAPELAKWLEEHWVASDALPADEQEQRRTLGQQLSDTDGFELLAACTTKDTKVPFV